MIFTTQMLLEKYKDYVNPYAKIKRMVSQKQLFLLTKGLYEDNPNLSPAYIAGAIYGPSYISFNFALAEYGLIPERVVEVTCATTEKKKRKIYTNYFARYSYRDVPVDVFRYGVNLVNSEGYSYWIATPEKALCDQLYTLSPVKNLKEMKDLLFNNMRIEEDEFYKLNTADIEFLAKRYHCGNVKYLAMLIKRGIR